MPARLPPGGLWLPPIWVHWSDVDADLAPLALTEETRPVFAKAIALYNEDIGIWRASSGAGKVRADLVRARRRVSVARGTLDALRHEDEAALEWLERWPAREGENITEIRLGLARLIARLDLAIRALPDSKVGPPENPYRSGFLRRLHTLFEEAGGTGLYTNRNGVPEGPFLMAAQRVLMRAEARDIGLDATVDAIAKAFRS
jgi:hypothetical protein